MKGLLNKVGATAPNHTEPGLEAVIGKQSPNDPVVLDSIAVLENLINYYKDNNIQVISNKHDQIQDAMEKLEKIFSKRFGINFKFTTEDTSFLAIQETGPDMHSGLHDLKSFLDSLRAEYGEEELMKHDVWKNYMAHEKYVRENPVVIDLEKARFKTFPKDSSITLHINLAPLVGIGMLGYSVKQCPEAVYVEYEQMSKDGYQMTPKTLVAMILHEVGHAFSFYSYLHVTRATRVVFEDTLKDQIRKGNNPKNAVYVAYQSAFSKKSNHKIKQGDGISKIIINVLRTEGEQFGFTGNKASSTDSEFVADQFVSRFGLGSECASALVAVNKFNLKFCRTFRDLNAGLSILWLLSCIYTSGFYSSLILFYSISMAVGIVSSVITAALPFMFLYIVHRIGSAGYKPVYDPDLRRYERLRLDVIRQIRLYEKHMPKKEVERLLKEADDIKAIINQVENEMPKRFTFLYNIIGFVGDAKKEDNLDKVLEETMENDLHLAALRFK